MLVIACHQEDVPPAATPVSEITAGAEAAEAAERSEPDEASQH